MTNEKITIPVTIPTVNSTGCRFHCPFCHKSYLISSLGNPGNKKRVGLCLGCKRQFGVQFKQEPPEMEMIPHGSQWAAIANIMYEGLPQEEEIYAQVMNHRLAKLAGDIHAKHLDYNGIYDELASIIQSNADFILAKNKR